MATPITIFKNNQRLREESNIQLAATFFSDLLNLNKSKCFNAIERGYTYNIPFFDQEDEYRFIAPKDIALKRRIELEERDHHNARRIWLIPANPNEYDLESAFGRYDFLHWRRSFNYENGDILFIYLSGYIQKVRYKVEVIEGVVRSSDVNYDLTFRKSEDQFEDSKELDWSRIRLIDEVDTDLLSLEYLREYGLKGNIQGSMKLMGELKDYITSFFDKDLTAEYYADEVAESLEEGKRKVVTVNTYERNPLARKRCMEYYGVSCQVCQINFEKIYGEVGRDFIHVHHIKPLHEIGQNYVVDPITDLRPVCPNCHAMLHRKEGGEYLTIEQLKNRIKSNPGGNHDYL
ncbi:MULTISPECIES: HNH endonuclease [unclassified Exiguobacterium]|uniref:HNH endonuclease n=1 Tax=Exiguobacterium sp. (strain ATCC BAA-1283 / AT1b) TaxID=360911 RepID=C4L1L5_EXISA|nr:MULTISPECIES: HNH endonuclease [unclassified Exiguobacterium]ACQ71047.1 HNH endonuclease [Exiguobacterium sp. AT1b]